jgi:hypothetical protein
MLTLLCDEKSKKVKKLQGDGHHHRYIILVPQILLLFPGISSHVVEAGRGGWQEQKPRP